VGNFFVSCGRFAKIVTSKEIGVQVNAESTREHHAGQNSSVKIGNRFSKGWDHSNIWGKTRTNQNCIHEEITSRLKSGNACCYSVQTFLSSRLLSKNVKKIYTDL
jgi:hypothetical protein